ncbi:hypothetical protein [Sporosarcina sp. P13]|uniref:hypothetical protein n=1 Tax=Sporosarcina sp. P13 TaxID=2048263 RepID=UPI0013045866|nr:hypothetical protein [Sporosarcina sp. P13]
MTSADRKQAEEIYEQLLVSKMNEETLHSLEEFREIELQEMWLKLKKRVVNE